MSDFSDLGERLLEASSTLFELQAKAYREGDLDRMARLKAKRSGVELALSYLVEAEREIESLGLTNYSITRRPPI